MFFYRKEHFSSNRNNDLAHDGSDINYHNFNNNNNHDDNHNNRNNPSNDSDGWLIRNLILAHKFTISF